MKIPRIRAVKLASAMLAGGIALSTVLGPALLPADLGGSAARAAVEVSIDVFQQELSPYGRWTDDPRYGQVWYPDVREGWRPYYDDGHWEYSDDYGWLWVSDAPWGWAPFHYGRWVLTDYGWAWVPGTVWGPAWVSFRSAPDYIGWAPLPPEDDWDDGYGFRNRYDETDARFWIFVRPQGFVERRFDRYTYDRRDYPRFIHNTTNITNITIINNRVVNRGIQVDHVERLAHRRVDRVRVADSDRPTRTEVQGNRVTIFRPRVVNTGNQQLRRQNLQQQTQPTFGTNEQPQTLKKRQQQTQPTFGTNEQPQTLKKRQQQTQPTFGTNEQPQTLKKRRQQQQFLQPQQMQPSAGGNETEQLPVKKKKRNNANINGGQQQFEQPQFGFPNDGGQPQVKKRKQQQFQNLPQVQQQPQIRQQRQQQQFQQPEQQQQRQVNKKKLPQQQCQNGTGNCGN